MNRRDFLRSSTIAAVRLRISAELTARHAKAQQQAATWDGGSVRHILPQVSDTRMLIKASFSGPLMSEPTLHIDNTTVRGHMSDTHGEFWQFHATGLRPAQRYQLAL